MLYFAVGFYAYFMFTFLSLFSRITLYLFFFFWKIDYSKTPSFSFLKKDFIGEFSRFIVFNFFSGMTGIVTETVDKLMTGSLISMSAAGIYTIVSQLTVFIRIISYAFNRIAHPLVAEYWEKQELNKIENLYKSNSNMQLFLGFYVFIIMVSFSAPILAIAGKEYIEWKYLMVFLSFGYLFDISTGGTANAIISYSKYYHYDLITRIFEIIVTIVTNFIFIPIWGLNGAAFASALALVSYNLLKIVIIWKKFKITPFNFNTLKIFILAFSIIILLKIFNRHFFTFNLALVIMYSFTVLALYVFVSYFILKIDFVRDNARKIIAGKLLWKN
jgi:O-antigen/teichoic acid export membrane protein